MSRRSARRAPEPRWGLRSREGRRRAALLALAVAYAGPPNLLAGVAAAAPQVFARQGAGVSRLPLEVLAFGAPGFGEVADAINLASGNLYVDAAGASRNNRLAPGDEATNTVDGSGWNVTPRVRLDGFHKTLTAPPGSFTLYEGDGSGAAFERIQSPDFAKAPSWIQRYNGAGNVFLYRRGWQPGTQATEEWLALYIPSGSPAVAHRYRPDGFRDTFANDGQYADYTQNLHQQYRTVAANPGDAEGLASTLKTEITYTSATSGRIAKVKDEFGRVTTYTWGDGAACPVSTLCSINHLLASETDPSSWARRAVFSYTSRLVNGINQNLVSRVTYNAPDGKGNTVSRWVGFEYTGGTKSGKALVSKVQRQVLGGAATRDTSYTYDEFDRVRTASPPGEPVITYDYGAASTASVPALPTFLKGVNLNGAKATVEGEQWLSDADARAAGLTTSGVTSSAYAGTLTPEADDGATATVSNGVWSGGTMNLAQTLANGTYQLYLWALEDYSDYRRSFDVRLEGATVATGVGNLRKGEWRKYGPYSARVADGTLNLDLVKVTSDPRIEGFAIYKVPDAPASVTTLEPSGSLGPCPAAVIDAEASGGQALLLQCSGDGARFTAPADLAAGTYALKVKARADYYQGYPTLELRSGTTVLGSATVDAATYGVKTLATVAVSPGQALDVVFTNDASGGTPQTDRNAIADNLILEATSAPTNTDPVSWETGDLFSDSGAAGNQALRLWGYNSSSQLRSKVSFTVPSSLAAGTYTVSVRGRGEYYAGWPALDLMLGGAVKGSVELDSSTYVTRGYGAFQLSPGQTVELAFLNDAYGGSSSTDRNAIVDHLILQPATVATGFAVTVSQGSGTAAKVSAYEFDQAGRMVSREERDHNPAVGASMSTGAPSGVGRDLVWRYQYYRDGSTAGVVEPSGKSTHYFYDARRNVSRVNVYATATANPGSEVAGWTRQQLLSYDNDNRLTEETTPARSGTVKDSSFNYAEVKIVRAYADQVAYCCNLPTTGTLGRYAATAQETVTTRVGGVDRNSVTTTYDTVGRVTREQRAGAGQTLTTDRTYWDGTTWQPYLPDSIGAVSATRGTAVKQYADLVKTTTTGARTTTVYYDAFGNVAHEERPNAFLKEYASGTETAEQRGLQRSFDGFGNQVWERLYAGTVPNAGFVTKRMWHYLPTGELDWSFDALETNVTDYQHATSGADLGRVTSIVSGPGSNGGVTTQRARTDLSYDAFGRVATRTNDGFATTLTYDTLNRVVREVRPDNGSTITAYHTSGEVERSTVSDPVSGTTATTENTIDTLGRIVSQKDPAQYTVNTWYDPYDQPVQVEDNRLEMVASSIGRSRFLVYDSLGNLTKDLGPELVTATGEPYADSRRPYVENGYDNLSRRVTETRLLNGSVTPSSIAMPAGSATAITRTSYTLFDEPEAITDPEDYTTRLAYDNSGNLKSREQLVCKAADGVCKAGSTIAASADGTLTATSRFTYEARGLITQAIDPLGNRRKTAFDRYGNPVSETDARNVVTKLYAYTADGLLDRVAEPDMDPSTGATGGTLNSGGSAPAGYVLTKVHEYGGRQYPSAVRVAVMSTDAGVNAYKTEYVYDHAGRVTRATLPADQSGNRAAITSRYDARGNLVETTNAEGFTTRYAFDALGRKTSEVQPARSSGGVVSSTDSDAGLAGGLSSSYAYWATGNLKVKTERGLSTYFRWNSLNKITGESRPTTSGEGNRRLRTYRLDGELTAETTYDYAGSLASIASAVGTSNMPSASDGNVTVFDLSARGKRTKEISQGVSPATGNQLSAQESSATNNYDGLGRRVRRVFTGDLRIFTEVPKNDGYGSGSASYNTYWQYRADGMLYRKWDTLPDGSNARNDFTYYYSLSGKEVQQNRTVILKGRADGIHTDLVNGFLVAATVATIKTTYNERDLLEKTEVSDKGAMNVSDLGSRSRTTAYEYHLDGRKKKVTVSEGTTTVGVQEYPDYDPRGRVVRSRDSNGSEYIAGPTTTTFTYATDGTTTEFLTQDGSTSYRYVVQTVPTVGALTRTSKVWDMSTPLNSTETLASWPDKPSKTVSYAYSSGALPATVDVTEDSWQDCACLAMYSVRQTDTSRTQNTFNSTYRYLDKAVVDATSYHPRKGTTTTRAEATQAHTTSNDLYRVDETRTVQEPNTTAVTTTSSTAYTLDSVGGRTTIMGGPQAGTKKRYDADRRMEEFTPPPGGTSIQYFTTFQYDPFGARVLSEKLAFHQPGSGTYRIERRTVSDLGVDGNVQAVMKGEGQYGYYCDSTGCWKTGLTTAEYQFKLKDETFGLADGASNAQWDVLAPFEVPSVRSPAALEAPMTPLSADLNLDPLTVKPPNQNLPPVPSGEGSDRVAPPQPDPGAKAQPAAPTSAGGGTSVSGLSTGSGLQGLPALAPSVPPAGATALPSAPAAPLAASSSALPPSLGVGLNPSSVLAPYDARGSVPSDLPDAGRVGAPGAASPPALGATPSEGVPSIRPPAGLGTTVVPPISGAGPTPIAGTAPPVGWRPAREAKVGALSVYYLDGGYDESAPASVDADARQAGASVSSSTAQPDPWWDASRAGYSWETADRYYGDEVSSEVTAVGNASGVIGSSGVLPDLLAGLAARLEGDPGGQGAGAATVEWVAAWLGDSGLRNEGLDLSDAYTAEPRYREQQKPTEPQPWHPPGKPLSAPLLPPPPRPTLNPAPPPKQAPEAPSLPGGFGVSLGPADLFGDYVYEAPDGTLQVNVIGILVGISSLAEAKNPLAPEIASRAFGATTAAMSTIFTAGMQFAPGNCGGNFAGQLGSAATTAAGGWTAFEAGWKVGQATKNPWAGIAAAAIAGVLGGAGISIFNDNVICGGR